MRDMVGRDSIEPKHLLVVANYPKPKPREVFGISNIKDLPLLALGLVKATRGSQGSRVSCVPTAGWSKHIELWGRIG